MDTGKSMKYMLNYLGDAMRLTGLAKPGDCVEFWSPLGYAKPISDDLRRFNDRIMSVNLPLGTCLRLYENNCRSGRTIKSVRYGSAATLDTSKGGLGNAISAIELINC